MLITDLDALHEIVRPILAGEVERAAFDTETTEIFGDRFTPFGTNSRVAGFSISYGDVDFYACVRHEPYDWRRRQDLIERDAKHGGPAWVRRLLDEEGVTPEGTWAEGWNPNLPLEPVVELWRRLFALPGVTWGGHNWPFDARMVQADGAPPPWGRHMDTQVWSVFTDERPIDAWDEENDRWVHQGHGLKHLGEHYLGVDPEAQKLLHEARKVLQCDSYAHLPLRTIVAPYACMDTRLTLRLMDHMLGRPLAQDERVAALIQEHHAEQRRVVDMEARGVCVDLEMAAERAQEREQEQEEIRVRAHGLAKRVVPLDQPAELEVLLYDTLGLPLYRSNRNTREATLKQIRAKLAEGRERLAPGVGVTETEAIGLLDAILDYRKVTKDLTGFYRPMLNYGEGGVIHTILNPLAARTTRYSSSKPNVQQATKPKKGKELRSVRAAYKPRDGHCFVPLDYSQKELRAATHYAGAIPEAFQYRFSWNCTLKRRGDCKGKPPHGEGEVHVGRYSSWSRAGESSLERGFMSGDRAFDPHATMVERCQAMGIEIDRDRGKTANFALIYGAWIYKLAETLDCTEQEAKQLYDVFWDKAYPELRRVKDFIGERLRQAGPAGQWSHQPSIRTIHGAAVFLQSGHKGFNYLIQRSCREILLKAVLSVGSYLEREAPDYHMLFPVHDEIVLEVPKDSLDQGVVRTIAKLMVQAGSASSIPMVVDPAVCYSSWAEKEPLDPETWGWNGVTDGV